MKIQFLGANRQVTGSRYLLEAGGQQVLIDCGLFQERDFQNRNWDPNAIPPRDVDAILLTHAHLDHCGLIPKLVKEGFRGPIYCTRATAPLADVVLMDSAKIQSEDAAYKQKRHRQENRTAAHSYQPLYDEDDVVKSMKLFQKVDYRQPVKITDAISVIFQDAGHILGSAMFEVVVSENGAPRRIIFSGDIGQPNRPIIRDPTMLEGADYVIMESTYGDRDHETGLEVATQLERVIRDTIARGGNVVIPTFAVERAQELMWHISRLVHANKIPDIPVYLDSPMSVAVMEIFHEFHDYFDLETWRMIQSSQSPLMFPGLRFARSVDESKAINRSKQPCIVMATSGMCTGGRIKHHLRANIGRPESTILFVGYQSEGTLGRQILDRRPNIRIHGQSFMVKAHIDRIYGFSGHADRSGLLKWLGHMKHRPKQVFLTHGEERAALSLAQQIGESMQLQVSVPHYRDVVELGHG
jgi:metallo-beta-lactamase family protein